MSRRWGAEDRKTAVQGRKSSAVALHARARPSVVVGTADDPAPAHAVGVYRTATPEGMTDPNSCQALLAVERWERRNLRQTVAEGQRIECSFWNKYKRQHIPLPVERKFAKTDGRPPLA